jgi:hypothetical protein
MCLGGDGDAFDAFEAFDFLVVDGGPHNSVKKL